MSEQDYAIGDVAGKIYRALENQGAKPSSTVQKEVGVSDASLFNQALGWLAREEKISLARSGRSVKVSLRESNG
ncbi:MAG: winged helix-turn-helix domain-containing protein [Candidatus Omnitrophota bacterium]|nr:winged helix-turn-helix domain-containing protein [Candidatus Omnitrophota bacterium]